MADIQIISERPQVTYPRPGEMSVMVALTYQSGQDPPRVVWIPQGELPDAMYRVAHPEATEAPAEIQRQGDAVRAKYIKADMEKHAKTPGPRTLKV